MMKTVNVSKTQNSASAGPAVELEIHTGFAATKVVNGLVCEYHLTFWHGLGEPLPMMFWRLDSFLRQTGAKMVRQEIFGSISAHAATMGNIKRLLGAVDWPVTWVEGASCFGGPIAGMHVLAVSGVDVETLSIHDRPVGRTYHDGLGTHVFLGDIHPTDPHASKTDQAKQAFDQLEIALAHCGMGMPSLVRTWIFLDDILSWYGPFNVLRKELFEAKHLFGHLLPASTGVGVKNPSGTAAVMGAWAVDRPSPQLRISELPSPMQCAAPQYGSCFSRAVEFNSPGLRRMIISGTASIGPDGGTVFIGDVEAQIEQTMSVVKALLASRQMDLSHITRATAYFKHIQDASAFSGWCHPAEPSFPVLVLQADVCRTELLFELELDAIAAVPNTDSATGQKSIPESAVPAPRSQEPKGLAVS